MRFVTLCLFASAILVQSGCGGDSAPAPSTDTAPAAAPGPESSDGGMDPTMEGPSGESAAMLPPEGPPGEGASAEALAAPSSGEEEMYAAGEPGMEMDMGMEPGLGMEPGMEMRMGMPGESDTYIDELTFATVGGQKNSPAEGMLAGLSGLLSGAGGLVKGSSRPLSLRDMANQAFMGGDEALALRLLHAHLAAEFDTAGAAYDDVRFSKALREPTWLVRWGTSIHVRGDSLTDTHPIVENMPSPITIPNRGAGQGGMRNNRAGGEAAMESLGAAGEMLEPASRRGAAAQFSPSNQIDQNLKKKLGLVAEFTGKNFDSRFADGSFGYGFVTAMASAQADAPQPPAGNRRPGGMEGMMHGEMEGMMEEEMAGMSAGALGMPAMDPASTVRGMPSPDSLRNRMTDPNRLSAGMNEPGMEGEMSMQAMEGMLPPGAAPPRAAGGQHPGQPAQTTYNPAYPRWRPGIVSLGEMSQLDALELAKKEGIQFLLHFDVSVQDKKNRTMVRVLNVTTGDTVVVSKKMDNVEVYRLVQAERTTEREFVEEIISEMFTVIDEKCKVEPMIKLTPEIAKQRIAALLQEAPGFDFSGMAEVRLFQFLGLLQENEVAGALHLFGGDDALTMMYAMPERRREIVLRELGISGN
ncbi:hypothetical protein [Roseimaritima multifibrata]|nr:hypothetical protein [Roseimaritima multifibrata]